MGRKPRSKTESSIILGSHLAKLRKKSKKSLRDVERETGGYIDDAYLSQIENGWVQFPHPLILRRLARLYMANYHQMIFIAYPGSTAVDENGTELFDMNGMTKEELLACQSFLQHFRATGRRP